MPSLNTKKVGQFLSHNNLWDKKMSELDLNDMERLAETIMDALEDFGGAWEPPYISMNKTLVIPWNAPLKYRWWQGGQSREETLEELGADDEVKAKYKMPEGTPKEKHLTGTVKD